MRATVSSASRGLTNVNPPKIFGIGFHKTGTTSLAVALGMLGYRVTGPNGIHDPDIATHVYQMVYTLVQGYDAFQDNPWPVLYKDLDMQCPGSKFILTIRPSEKWMRSIVRHFGRRKTPMREWIYGVGYPEGNEEVYLERYKKHNEEVLLHFKNRPKDLLILELEKGDGWERLCPFLGQPVPACEFPHVNRTLSSY